MQGRHKSLVDLIQVWTHFELIDIMQLKSYVQFDVIKCVIKLLSDSARFAAIVYCALKLLMHNYCHFFFLSLHVMDNLIFLILGRFSSDSFTCIQ